MREFEQRAGVKKVEVAKDPPACQYSSLLTEVPHAKCPVLVISGQNDSNAPLPVMEQYVSAFLRPGHAAEAYHPDNGPHGFYFGLPKIIPETAESTHKIVAFIKRHFEAVGQ